MFMEKRSCILTSRLELPIRLARHRPCLKPLQTRDRRVRRPSSRRANWKGRRCWRLRQIMLTPVYCIVLRWDPSWVCLTTPPLEIFCQVTASARLCQGCTLRFDFECLSPSQPSIWSLGTALWDHFPLPAARMHWPPLPGFGLVQWPGWLLQVYEEIDIASSDLLRAGSNERSSWQPLGVVSETLWELHSGYGRPIFAAQKAELVNRGCIVLHGFPNYNDPLEDEVSANDFLHTPTSFPKKTLYQTL